MSYAWAALVDAGTKVINLRALKKVAFQGNRLCTHWPPPLVASPSRSMNASATPTPRDSYQFVCPLTFGLMRQSQASQRVPQLSRRMGPPTRLRGSPVASWADAKPKGRYPATLHTSPTRPLLRSDLAPNLALRGMIEEWVAARSTDLV